MKIIPTLTAIVAALYLSTGIAIAGEPGEPNKIVQVSYRVILGRDNVGTYSFEEDKASGTRRNCCLDMSVDRYTKNHDLVTSTKSSDLITICDDDCDRDPDWAVTQFVGELNKSQSGTQCTPQRAVVSKEGKFVLVGGLCKTVDFNQDGIYEKLFREAYFQVICSTVMESGTFYLNNKLYLSQFEYFRGVVGSSEQPLSDTNQNLAFIYSRFFKPDGTRGDVDVRFLRNNGQIDSITAKISSNSTKDETDDLYHFDKSNPDSSDMVSVQNVFREYFLDNLSELFTNPIEFFEETKKIAQKEVAQRIPESDAVKHENLRAFYNCTVKFNGSYTPVGDCWIGNTLPN